MHVIPSTWVFRIKRFTDGTVRKLKARFCVCGDCQVEGLDFFETFAPVVNWITIRFLLILTVVLYLKTAQADYTAAFVHAPIDRPPNWDDMSLDKQKHHYVYVKMPPGFGQPGKVLRLKKSLYGLKEAPCNWFLHLKENLEKLEFVAQINVDICLFISPKVIVLIYVDDTMLFALDNLDIRDVVHQLRDAGFVLEIETNDVAGFLGVQITHDPANGCICMTQTALIKCIIETLGVRHTRQTPALTTPLTADKNGDPPQGDYNYASVVGMLGYLRSHTCPEITYAVSQVARYTHSPRHSHELALKQIGMYLKGTMEEGLILKPSDTF